MFRTFAPRVVVVVTTLFCSLHAAPARAESAVADALARSLATLHERGTLAAGGDVVRWSATLEDFYRRRGDEPAWSDRSSRQDLLAAITGSEQQGLVPSHYHLAAILAERDEEPRSAEEAATRDILRSDALLRLAEDLRYGSVRARTLAPSSHPALRSADPAGDLASAVDEGRIRELLEDLEPHSAFYRRLKSALATYRRIADAGGWPTVPAGPSLKPGATDRRIALLRERLLASGDLAGDEGGGGSDRYDAALVEAVRTFQSRHGLDADGVLGAGTVAALDVPATARVDQIRATLERCRWFLRDLPRRFVLVNVAGFRVLLLDDGQVVWRTRAIVGKPYTRTPMFRADMKSVILNPTWTVPHSIVRNETLPAIRRDPSYLAKKHISRIGNEYVQAAGPDNALGRIKLMLPNPYSVYLHDTPTRSLFERTTRAFSHGCVRIQNPVELAALVLDDPEWSVEALEAEIAKGRTREIRLARPVPVLVMYWSVTVSPEGTVEFLPDMYHRDEEVLRELDSDGPAPRDRR